MEVTRVINRRYVRADGSVRAYTENRKVVNTHHRMRLSPAELDAALDELAAGKAIRDVATGLHVPLPTLTRLAFARALERLRVSAPSSPEPAAPGQAGPAKA